MRRDSTIKKLLKIYFLYIFTIKIFLKNTLLCLNSQNKERRRQETHYYAYKVRILAFLARFKADFGHIGRIGRRLLRLDMADTAGFWPNQLGLVRIEADSARIEPRRCGLCLVGVNPRKKKKNSDVAPMCGQPRRTPCPVSSRVGRGCGILPAMSVLSRFEGSKIIARLSIWRASLFRRHFV